MLHGFTSTPNSFRPLAHHLSTHFGWEIHVPLLPGHGQTYDKLNITTFEQWIDACEKEFLKLKEKFSKVHLVGLSMGGTLCAHLSTKYPETIGSLILLSPALYLRDFWSRFFLPLVKFLPKSVLCRWIFEKEITDALEQISYHRYSAFAVVELNSLCKMVQKEFYTTKPCLIFSPIHDLTIHPKSSTWFLEHSSNPKSKIVELEQSPHVVFLGKENEKIFSETENFLKLL